MRDAGRGTTLTNGSVVASNSQTTRSKGKNIPVTAVTVALSSRQLLINMLAETARWWSAIGAEMEGSHGLGNAWENKRVGKLSATRTNAQYTEIIAASRRK